MNLALLTLLLPVPGGVPTVPPPPPAPAAFTFVKVLPPPGAKVTWYPGTTYATRVGEELPVGLRPGYSYRFEIANVGDRQASTIFPSIEVRGSLIPRPGMFVGEHPVPIVLSEEDIGRVLEGRLLTKVYYLEDPEKAINGPVIGIPVELTAASEADAIKEARLNGRIMIVVRVGERGFNNQELTSQNVPGTILLPGAKVLPMPAAPPHLLYAGIPLYDPLIGPAIAGGQECMYDGGDSKIPLGIGRDNKPYGIDPSDTAMEYTTPKGKKITTSNRVCICVPRFAATRVETAIGSYQLMSGPQSSVQLQPRFGIETRLKPSAARLIEQPIGTIGEVRASGIIGEKIPLTTTTLIGKLQVAFSIRGTQVHEQMQEAEDITTFCDALFLQKLMDPPHPKQIGEIVTFTLIYYNKTNQPITDVVISDSLTGRLEYIEGSAKTDRPSTFTASPNEAGSLLLRWAVDGKLLPGQRGNISFKARIR